jgi:hypothetical protein
MEVQGSPEPKKQKTEGTYLWKVTSRVPNASDEQNLPLHITSEKDLSEDSFQFHGVYDSKQLAVDWIKKYISDNLFDRAWIIEIEKLVVNESNALKRCFEIVISDQGELARWGSYEDVSDADIKLEDKEDSEEEGSDSSSSSSGTSSGSSSHSSDASSSESSVEDPY